MIAGINYPWTVVNGRPNYGCDCGRNIWNSHTGVSTHVDEVRADLETMAALGIEVARWFVFTDGRGGVRWGALIEPLLDAYGTGGPRADLGQAIHSFDVINEPDWVTAGLEPPLGRDTLSIDQLRAFVGDVSARIHARSPALVTLGGERVRFASEWDHPAYALDFIQVHSYPDVRYQDRDTSVFGCSAASFGLSKPLLIGKHAASPRQHPPDHLPPAYWPEDYQGLVREGGYLGAWPWSFKGVDAFGAPKQKGQP